jgi:hypothetical protein
MMFLNLKLLHALTTVDFLSVTYNISIMIAPNLCLFNIAKLTLRPTELLWDITNAR